MRACEGLTEVPVGLFFLSDLELAGLLYYVYFRYDECLKDESTAM